MAVSVGLLEQMHPDEVEAVLGHEIGHVANGDMVTLMNDDELTTLEQVRGFVDGTHPVSFEIRGKDACYAWIERTLFRFHYRRLGRADKGLVRYLMKVSGYSSRT